MKIVKKKLMDETWSMDEHQICVNIVFNVYFHSQFICVYVCVGVSISLNSIIMFFSYFIFFIGSKDAND